MDDQSNQAPQDPQNSPQTELNSENSSSTKKALITALLIIILLGGALGGFWWFMMREKPTPQSNSDQKVPATLSKNPVVCVGMGIKYLQCKNVETNKVVKYELPEMMINATHVVPSPDGQKIAVNYWDNGTHKRVVVDTKLEPIGKVKAVNETWDSPQWIDNESLLQVKSAKSDEPKAQLSKVNVVTGEVEELTDVAAGIEMFMPVGDGQYIYGIRAKADKATQSVLRHLVLINLQEKAEKDVTNDAVNVNENEIFFDQGSQAFYADTVTSNDDGSNPGYTVQIFKGINVETNPSLVKEDEIKNVVISHENAYTATTTTKGLVVHRTDNTDSEDLADYLVMGSEQPKPLDLVVGGFVDAEFSLATLPDFKQAASQEVVTEDFLEYPKATPKKIVTFLEDQVANAKSCHESERVAFKVEKYDGDKQFRVAAAGCDFLTTMYYVTSGDTYKGVPGGMHGLECETKEKYSLSDVIAPACRKQGDPL